jgi:hypothetical protein
VRETAATNDPTWTGWRDVAPADVDRVTAIARRPVPLGSVSRPARLTEDVSTIEIFANGRAAFGAENRKSKQPTRTSATATDPKSRRLERKTARADAVEIGTAISAQGPTARTPKRDHPVVGIHRDRDAPQPGCAEGDANLKRGARPRLSVV